MTATRDTYLAGDRLPFVQAPEEVRRRVADVVGGEITGVRDARGGMSRGVAAVVTGPQRSVFVKGCDALSNPFAYAAYANETDYAERLPRHPSIPALLERIATEADGVEWLVTVFEAVEGEPPRPWTRDKLARCLDAWAGLQPALHSVGWSERSTANVSAFLDRWRLISDDSSDPWHSFADRWTAPCHELANRSEGDETGTVLAHFDLRADNIVLGERVAFVDWAHPGIGAPWIDVTAIVVDASAMVSDDDILELWHTHPAISCWSVGTLATMAAALAAGHHFSARKVLPDLPHHGPWNRVSAERHLAFANRLWDRGIRPSS